MSLVLIFLFSVCSISIYGQVRNIGNFTAIEASTNVAVKLIKADSPRIEFKMLRGNEKDLITKIKENKLIVKIDSDFGGSKAQAQVKVYYTELKEISASAGASIKGEELIYADAMDVEASSGAYVDLEIEAKSINVDVSSGATMALEGTAVRGNFDSSSGSTLNAKRMICDHVSADASSGSTLKITANKSFDGDDSSGASIQYSGDVEASKSDAGWSGSIRKI